MQRCKPRRDILLCLFVKERLAFLYIISQVPELLELVSSWLKTLRIQLTSLGYLASVGEDDSVKISSLIIVNESSSPNPQSPLCIAIFDTRNPRQVQQHLHKTCSWI